MECFSRTTCLRINTGGFKTQLMTCFQTIHQISLITTHFKFRHKFDSTVVTGRPVLKTPTIYHYHRSTYLQACTDLMTTFYSVTYLIIQFGFVFMVSLIDWRRITLTSSRDLRHLGF